MDNQVRASRNAGDPTKELTKSTITKTESMMNCLNWGLLNVMEMINIPKNIGSLTSIINMELW